MPSGAGRRAILNFLNQPDQGPKSDRQLLLQGASNPPGNLRIKQAAQLLEQQPHPGFEKSEIVERAEKFIEYARGHGAPESGSSGVQGDAPKRAIVGMTQPEYAKFVGIAPRIIIDLERGVGNPTLSTLRKIGKPFRLEIMFSYK